MKRSNLIIVIGVIAALLLVTAQAFAAAPQADLTGKPTPKPHDGQIDDDKGKPDKPFKLNQGKKEVYHGVILSVDAASLTVQMEDGTTATVALTAETRLHVPTLGLTATAADLLPEMRVMVKARPDEAGILTALSVNVIMGDGEGDDDMEEPEPGESAGIVTEYIPGTSITIQMADGAVISYGLSPNVKIVPHRRADLLDVGASVTVVLRDDMTGAMLTAKGIVVHPPAGDEDGD